jgi:hypothetical protein
MGKLFLLVGASIAIMLALGGSMLIARTQSVARFEYSRVSPYNVPQREGQIVYLRVGYRACVAAAEQWACRDFGPQDSSEGALRTALATLGNEGWELVSATPANPTLFSDGLIYLFKRHRQ